MHRPTISGEARKLFILEAGGVAAPNSIRLTAGQKNGRLAIGGGPGHPCPTRPLLARHCQARTWNPSAWEPPGMEDRREGEGHAPAPPPSWGVPLLAGVQYKPASHSQALRKCCVRLLGGESASALFCPHSSLAEEVRAKLGVPASPAKLRTPSAHGGNGAWPTQR